MSISFKEFFSENQKRANLTTDSDLEILESLLGVTLPDKLKGLLKLGAGRLTIPCGPTWRFHGKLQATSIRCFHHGKPQAHKRGVPGSELGIIDAWRYYSGTFGENVVPIAFEGGDNGFFALFYLSGSKERYTVVYYEFDDVDENEVPIRHHVADSMESFLELFVPVSEEE
ncbi:SMI1/KNR4 family protein [Teredinibacter turnerae]|uniref:SMI1/KNR4 family protein n=1 Tax=Teredinibacter turnerae TaxID=2426 RepID=UPI00037C060C|nr:SMI1/KNR4 family protein [Teredinibacter turnerae]